MALDDFDSIDSPAATPPAPAATPLPVRAALSATAIARKPANPDDEDLFDFPVVEMKLEAEAPKPAPAAAPAPAPAKPAKAPATAAPAAAAPAKEAPKPAAAPAKAQDKKDVAKAAQLVEDIEQVLGSDSKTKKKRGLQLQGPSALTLAGIAVLVLTNAFGLFFLWRTSHSFQTGVQAMNEQLADTLRRQTQLLAQPDPSGAHGSQGSHSTESGGPVPAPLEAFEKAALQTAREEIQAGEYGVARRRLSRLLALADRMGAEEREEIEAQAAFLIASTYRKQAEAAREKAP